MNALIDTNVIVDVLTRRETFFADSSRVLDRAERGDFVASICATTVTTVFYLVRPCLGATETVERLKDLTAICTVAPVNQSVIDSALHDRFSDFEDAVLHHSAALAGADCIVTRNEADFRESSFLIYSPTQLPPSRRPKALSASRRSRVPDVDRQPPEHRKQLPMPPLS